MDSVSCLLQNRESIDRLFSGVGRMMPEGIMHSNGIKEPLCQHETSPLRIDVDLACFVEWMTYGWGLRDIGIRLATKCCSTNRRKKVYVSSVNYEIRLLLLYST